jgi:5'-3' exonuclease
MTIALIDGDILCYRCAFAAEKTKYLVYDGLSGYMYDAYKDIPKNTPKEYIWSRKEVEPEELAVVATQATLDSILQKLGTDQYEIYLSGPISFRERVATTAKYKGNREGAQRPVHFGAVRSALLSMGATVCSDELEADDLLGIRATSLGDGCVIVSIDKDLLQIPGRHFNWVSGEDRFVDRRDGTLSLGCQLLSGDPTDNVPGLAGIGETKARKLLEGSSSTSEVLARVREAYKAQCGDNWESYLMEQGQLVYILRDYKDSFFNWYKKHTNAEVSI